jgi:hypothetical protein
MFHIRHDVTASAKHQCTMATREKRVRLSFVATFAALFVAWVGLGGHGANATTGRPRKKNVQCMCVENTSNSRTRKTTSSKPGAVDELRQPRAANAH